MVKIRLPDGKVLEFPDGITAAEVVSTIGPGLARKTVAVRAAGQVVDLATRFSAGEIALQALTESDADALTVLRHSCAHVMAEAICALWPRTKLVYGPPVENGYYYDIDLDHNLTPEDFAKIEAKMQEIVKSDRPFTRYELPRSDALAKLEREGNEYKVDNAQRAEGDTLSFYVTGAAGSGCWEDLCRGPHIPSTGRVGAFKVMQVAGAYHHGDASRKMLQRVYGTAFFKKAELQAHLTQLEEARKRDHRRLGPELGLFTLDPLVGSGLVLWKPRGARERFELEGLMREQLMSRGYQPVYTPHIGRLDLYRTSGHFPYYRDAQFPPLFETDTARILNELWIAAYERGDENPAGPREMQLLEELKAIDARTYAVITTGAASGNASSPDKGEARRKYELGPGCTAHNQALIREHLREADGFLLKPMNCPMHIRIYASEARSYRDLPVRLAEFGTVYRYEKSGEVSGMTRVRGFTQDDAHIFCTQGQLQAEIADCVELTCNVLSLLKLKDFRVRVGLRDDADKYVGSRENWAAAEAAIRRAVQASGMPFTEEPGEAAFYGPKIDFVVRDAIGREWQLGTVQADYNLPERFDLSYIGDDNRPHRPVMVHRAPFGSLERFCAILIEHFAGAFPLWLAPVQAVICTVSEKSCEYAGVVFEAFRKAGLRVELDAGGERIGAKIRSATMAKVPYIIVIGEQEVAGGSINVRTREGKQLGSCEPAQFLAACALEIQTRETPDPAVAGQTTA
ncbi:MAG: threonine--tRNA ligase [Planctomycetes bacterium]|nr:threonine--tRNA ligase [Planctomycetota bacterium]